MTVVVIRADASVSIGSGHVMRCLALAEALKAARAKVAFVCREHEGNLCSLVQAARFPIFRLPDESATSGEDAEQTIEALGKAWSAADWIVVDHYGLDENWEKRIRRLGGRIMAIDDFTGRDHDCDLLLDQNVLPGTGSDYASRVPRSCRMLLGPQHALLRTEFARERARLRPRDGELRRVLIFFGGSDPTNETSKALDGVLEFGRSGLAIDVVVGAANPHRDTVQRKCGTSPHASYHCQVGNMAELMAKADLSLGAGGSASWERCCLALPTIAAVLADNQARVAETLARQGALVNLGESGSLDATDYSTAIGRLDKAALREMSRVAGTLVDGRGADRVAAELVGRA